MNNICCSCNKEFQYVNISNGKKYCVNCWVKRKKEPTLSLVIKQTQEMVMETRLDCIIDESLNINRIGSHIKQQFINLGGGGFQKRKCPRGECDD